MYFYYPERRTGTADVSARMRKKLAIKELLFAGIQAAGGAALAVYTYENSASRICPSVCSVVALGGTYNALRSMRKIFWRSACNKADESCSVNNVVTGTIIYFGSLYAFSEAWRSNDKLWIPFLGSAALGLYYAVSSTHNKKTDFTMKPLLKCCQLSFEPTLIVGGATYLMCFRNHEEEWVYWFPWVATGLTGFKFGVRGFYTVEYYMEDEEKHKILLLKAIEILMGGCILTVSSTILAIYASVKEIHQSWKSYALATGSFGVLIIMGAITALYRILPRPVFIRYCQRALGPLLIVSSSAASAYIGYRFGWNSQYCLLMMPFVPTGIYVTYKGFSRMK